MIRAQAYRDAGGFDERFFMYWEEAEFCLRCTRAGWRVLTRTQRGRSNVARSRPPPCRSRIPADPQRPSNTPGAKAG